MRKAAYFALGLLASINSFGEEPRRSAGLNLPIVRRIDPCAIASADQLKTLLAAGIGGYFPISQQSGGDHVRIDKPDIRTVTCPNLRIEAKAGIKYWVTRGFPQFSTSGEIRFTSPLVAVLQFAPGSLPDGLAASELQSARACLTNIQVTNLDLHNIPNWLDNGYLKDMLNKRLADTACFDVTTLVRAYLTTKGPLQ